MIDDMLTPDSPGWWFARLAEGLDARRENFDLLDAYYRGVQPVPHLATKAVRQAYARLMDLARTNYATLVVDAERERMMPQGFRTGAETDAVGDAEAWRIWQANSLDADIDLILTPQLVMGASYVIVGPPDPEIGAPVITPEDPRQVIAAFDPLRRRKVSAALKVFHDDVAGADRAYVFLPGRIYRFARDHREWLTGAGTGGLAAGDWTMDAPVQELPATVRSVPVVPFLNRADRHYWPTSEIQPHLGLLDRINFTILERVEIATLQAFRQRAIKGIPVNDEHGQPIDYDDVFAADPGALWQLPDTASIWESAQVDLGPIRMAIRDDVQDLAAVTRTPLFYLVPEGANQSAEGASLAREGLVFRTEAALRQAGESLEAAMALAFGYLGDEQRANRRDMEVIWRPPERHSLTERAQAAQLAIAGGMPWRTVMLDIWERSPQEVDRMEAERAGEQLLARLALPSSPEPAPAVPEDLTALLAEGGEGG